MPEFTTACPRNCYSTCSFKVEVVNGKVTSIRPHPANLATPEGPCIKGLAYVERANAPDRILFPLQKQPDGQFTRIDWDDALTQIAGRLQRYKAESGPHAILFYAASGMSGQLNGVSTNFWKLFGGATTTYGNLCWPAGLEATRLTLGANKHNDPWDLENARLIVVWGKNPAETNIQEMMHIDRSLAAGGRLVVIDPRRTATADKAHLMVQIRPGTDAALALGIANTIIQKNLIDHHFIHRSVNGFEAFAARAAQFDPDRVGAICDIPASAVEQLAETFATIKPMTLIPGYGMQRFSNGGQTIRALLALQVITGNIGKPGACWHYANLQSYVFDPMKEPESYYPGSEAPCFRRAVSMARLGEDLFSLTDPPVKMIWVERGNPLTQNPDTPRVREAFRRAEFRVVIEQFMTDTAREADLILPAKNMFEQSDLIGSYWNPYIQLKQKVTEPAGEVKPESEIYYLLAKKLGFDPAGIERNIPRPGDAALEEWLMKPLNQFPELSLEKLKTGPQLVQSHEPVPFSDGYFPTPSGKIELESQTAHEKWGVDSLPDYVPIGGSAHYPLLLMSPNSKNRIHSQFGNLSTIRQFEPEAILFVHPEDAAARGVENAGRAILFNEKGTAGVKVGFDLGLKKGCVVLTNGHWASDGATPNLFTTGKLTDMGFGTAFHDTRVDFKKETP